MWGNAGNMGIESVSPSVYGFDVNALDNLYADPVAGTGASVPGSASSVPSSDGAAVNYEAAMEANYQASQMQAQDENRRGQARLVPNEEEMGNLRVQPTPAQPPPAHRMQGYPYQGHPQEAQMRPFLGPDGTSPMNRGGPNMGAYAAAPGQPMSQVANVHYPQQMPGTYSPNTGWPSPGAYAGIPYGDAQARQERRADRQAARQESRTQRDVNGSGGYVYRQFHTGDIQVLVSADPQRLKAGAILTKGSNRWSAVTAEIGTWESYVKARSERVGSAVGAGVGAAAQAAIGILGKKERKGRKRRKGAPAVPGAPMPDPLLEEVEEEGGVPSWVPWAAAGVGTIVLVALIFSGKGEKGGKG